MGLRRAEDILNDDECWINVGEKESEFESRSLRLIQGDQEKTQELPNMFELANVVEEEQ